VLSAGWVSCELAIDLIDHAGAELAPLCTHSFPLERVADAVSTLGREGKDSENVVHVTLQVER
jgi:hypothetical protein